MTRRRDREGRNFDIEIEMARNTRKPKGVSEALGGLGVTRPNQVLLGISKSEAYIKYVCRFQCSEPTRISCQEQAKKRKKGKEKKRKG